MRKVFTPFRGNGFKFSRRSRLDLLFYHLKKAEAAIALLFIYVHLIFKNTNWYNYADYLQQFS
jgi:hypothetical protein